MSSIFEIKDNFAQYKDVVSELQYGNFDTVKNPTVSIIVPCYKHPRYLKKALLSAINQDYDKKYEIVVVDNDDSSEFTENRKIVEELNSEKILYYHNKKNIGPIGNWNRGVELAKAPYITYCHDDDMLLPNCLSILMECQSRHGDKAVFGLRNYIDKDDKITFETKFHSKFFSLIKPRQEREYTLMHHFLLPMGFCVGSLYNRCKFIELGGFGTHFSPIDDAAFAGCYVKYFGAIQPLIPTHNYRIAENDTFNVYREIATAAKHIRESDMPIICWPNWLKKCIIKATFKVSNYKFIKNFEPDNTDVMKPSTMDQIISRISEMIDRVSLYKIL